MPGLKSVPTPPEAPYTADHLARELYDPISDRLPRIPVDDPGRAVHVRLLPPIGAALELPRVRILGGDA